MNNGLNNQGLNSEPKFQEIFEHEGKSMWRANLPKKQYKIRIANGTEVKVEFVIYNHQNTALNRLTADEKKSLFDMDESEIKQILNKKWREHDEAKGQREFEEISKHEGKSIRRAILPGHKHKIRIVHGTEVKVEFEISNHLNTALNNLSTKEKLALLDKDEDGIKKILNQKRSKQDIKKGPRELKEVFKHEDKSIRRAILSSYKYKIEINNGAYKKEFEIYNVQNTTLNNLSTKEKLDLLDKDEDGIKKILNQKRSEQDIKKGPREWEKVFEHEGKSITRAILPGHKHKIRIVHGTEVKVEFEISNHLNTTLNNLSTKEKLDLLDKDEDGIKKILNQKRSKQDIKKGTREWKEVFEHEGKSITRAILLGRKYKIKIIHGTEVKVEFEISNLLNTGLNKLTADEKKSLFDMDESEIKKILNKQWREHDEAKGQRELKEVFEHEGKSIMRAKLPDHKYKIKIVHGTEVKVEFEIGSNQNIVLNILTADEKKILFDMDESEIKRILNKKRNSERKKQQDELPNKKCKIEQPKEIIDEAINSEQGAPYDEIARLQEHNLLVEKYMNFLNQSNELLRRLKTTDPNQYRTSNPGYNPMDWLLFCPSNLPIDISETINSNQQTASSSQESEGVTIMDSQSDPYHRIGSLDEVEIERAISPESEIDVVN
jgi:translation initiation factor IF-1